MSPIVFGLTFTIGSGALAAWVDVRTPRLAPEEVKSIVLHAITAMAALHLAATVVDFGRGSDVATLAAVFGACLPALTYAFLVGLWTVKLMSDALRGLPR